jgi:autotransporter-associated beta strand protein
MAGTSVTGSGHRIIGAGTLELNWPSKAINVFDAPAANDLTISTAISGPGGFTKTGPGRLFVNGPSVQGAAIVNAGSLAAQGAFNGGIALANGTTLIAGGLVTADTLTTPTLAFGAGADGAGGMLIWPLFGTTNQLLAGLTLSIITVILIRQGRPVWFTAVPLAFLLTMSVYALLVQLGQFYRQENWLLLGMDIIILMAALWVALEAAIAMSRGAKGKPVVEQRG